MALIDRDAFIKDLQEEFHGMVSDESLKIYKIIQRLQNAPVINETQWISVEDKLPDKEGLYLVHYHDDITGEYVTTREYWKNAKKFAPMEYFEKHTGRKALHWQPIPEPPDYVPDVELCENKAKSLNDLGIEVTPTELNIVRKVLTRSARVLRENPNEEYGKVERNFVLDILAGVRNRDIFI